MGRFRRVTLDDIPLDQERMVLTGIPIYRVFCRDRRTGNYTINASGSGVRRSWAVLGWMYDASLASTTRGAR